MKIKDVMTKNPTYLHPDASVKELAEQMKRLDAGVIPIGNDEKLLGMVTDRDIVLSLADGSSSDSKKASDIMTKSVHYCYENDSISEASDKMCDLQVRRLIVLDNEQNKKLSGIVSMGDIARGTHDIKTCGHIVEEVSEEARKH